MITLDMLYLLGALGFFAQSWYNEDNKNMGAFVATVICSLLWFPLLIAEFFDRNK